jgi:hypothetical protein
MTTIILILAALMLPFALLYLTLAANDFEKNTKTLAAILHKRYHIEPPKKASDATQSMQSIVKLPGKP